MKPEHLWGLRAIGNAIGVSDDTVRRLVKDPASGIPVTRPGGRYYAARSELPAWLRRR